MADPPEDIAAVLFYDVLVYETEWYRPKVSWEIMSLLCVGIISKLWRRLACIPGPRGRLAWTRMCSILCQTRKVSVRVWAL